MINAFKLHDRLKFKHTFDSMYEDRKKVFIDTLKWDIPHDGRREQDQYDTAAAHYLILSDPETGNHLGSVRLLPSTGGHILKDIFPSLCADAVPTGPHIWEITRLVISPSVNRRERFIVRNMLGRAMIEFGHLSGISQYTMVCEMGFLSQLLASGWRCDPLGLPAYFGNSLIGALLIHNDADSIARTRDAWRFESPTLRIADRSLLAA